MKTMTLKEFWKSLTPIDRDKLRKELADATFTADSTVDAYSYGYRSVPIRKRQIVADIIKRHHQVDVIF